MPIIVRGNGFLVARQAGRRSTLDRPGDSTPFQGGHWLG
jgi:hypothetical protein